MTERTGPNSSTPARPKAAAGKRPQAAASTEQRQALEIARGLIEAGVPVFVAKPVLDADGEWLPRANDGARGNVNGYQLPSAWQLTEPDPAVVDAWEPDDALCMVTGRGVDVIDVDPRNGGNLAALDGAMPTVFGQVATPSDGTHHFIASLGVRKSVGTVAPGIDVQAGDRDGKGRGFVWLPPTRKVSKVDGKVHPYTWTRPLDAAAVEPDETSTEFSALVESRRKPKPEPKPKTEPTRKGSSGGGGGGGGADVDIFADELDGPNVYLLGHPGVTIPMGIRDQWTFDWANWLRSNDIPRKRALEMVGHVRYERPDDPDNPFTVQMAKAKVRHAYRTYARPETAGAGDDDGKAAYRIVWAAEIKLRNARWLWHERVPLGHLTLLAGREGVGKSSIACQKVVADTTRGRLPGEFRGTPRRVLVVATEDSWETTIGPRLKAAGADMSMVGQLIVERGGRETPLDLEFDVDLLQQAVTEQDVALVVFDPLLSRLGGRLDSHKDQEVRLALEPLVAMADRTGCAVLGLIHFNKTATTDPLTAVMGSRAFTAVARSVLVAMADPKDPAAKLFGQAKTNLGPLVPGTTGYRIETAYVDGADERITTSLIVWGADDPLRTIHAAIVEAHESAKAPTVGKQTAAWIEDYLGRRPGRCAERQALMEDAEAAGWTVDQINKGRRELGKNVRSVRAAERGGKATWTLLHARPDPREQWVREQARRMAVEVDAFLDAPVGISDEPD